LIPSNTAQIVQLLVDETKIITKTTALKVFKEQWQLHLFKEVVPFWQQIFKTVTTD